MHGSAVIDTSLIFLLCRSVNNVDDDLVESHGNDDDIVCNLEAEKSGPTKSFTGTRLAISDTVQVTSLHELQNYFHSVSFFFCLYISLI